MKKLLSFFCVFFLCTFNLLSQEFEIKKVEISPFDLTASINPRVSLNNELCAVIIFEIPSPNAKFKGNVVGDISYECGEYCVYVSPGTKEIKILHDQVIPLNIKFSDFGINSLSSKVTYHVSLRIPFSSEHQQYGINSTKYLYTFEDEKTGYIGVKNSLDETIVDAIYEDVILDDEQYIIVVQNDKVGILDQNGKTLLPCDYDKPIDNTSDLIVACSKNGKWGIVNYRNETLLPFEYETINVLGGSHKGEIVSLKKNGKYTIADVSELRPKTGFIFDKLETGRVLFDNGLDCVYNPEQSQLIAIQTNNKWGFIDESGQYIISPQYGDGEDYRNRIFVNGTAAVEKDGKYGIINEKGKTIVPFIYSRIYMQLNDAPSIYYFAEDNQGYNIFSSFGEKITKRHYSKLDLCCDSLTSFEKNNKCGIIDLKTGEEVSAAVYDEIYSYGFGEDKIMVKKGDNWGCINRRGELVFDFIYQEVNRYSGGVCPVKKDGKWGLLKSNGLPLIRCEYDEVWYFGKDRLAGVKRDGRWALVNVKGKIVTPFIYSRVIPTIEDNIDHTIYEKDGISLRTVVRDGKYGCMDFRGVEVIPCKYQSREMKHQREKYILEHSNKKTMDQ